MEHENVELPEAVLAGIDTTMVDMNGLKQHATIPDALTLQHKTKKRMTSARDMAMKVGMTGKTLDLFLGGIDHIYSLHAPGMREYMVAETTCSMIRHVRDEAGAVLSIGQTVGWCEANTQALYDIALEGRDDPAMRQFSQRFGQYAALQVKEHVLTPHISLTDACRIHLRHVYSDKQDRLNLLTKKQRRQYDNDPNAFVTRATAKLVSETQQEEEYDRIKMLLLDCMRATLERKMAKALGIGPKNKPE